MEERVFTVRKSLRGQSDRLADILADAILDEYLIEDINCRTDIKVVITNNTVYMLGEVVSLATPDFERIIRNTMKEIGFEELHDGFDPYKCKIVNQIQRQSRDIIKNIYSKNAELNLSSDSGLVYSYATNESENYLPLPLNLINSIANRIEFVRHSGIVNGLKPDGQVLLTMNYKHDIPVSIASIAMTLQHNEDIELEWLRMELEEKVLAPVLKSYLTDDTKIIINPSGKFVVGGPASDTGISGKNIEIETFGGYARYGGLQFSGKDPHKINRTLALQARKIVLDIIRKKMAERVEIYLGYLFGIESPLFLDIETFGSGSADDQEILDYINTNYSFEISRIIKEFDLLKPIYKDLSINGYWGIDDYKWEELKVI